MPVAFGNVDVIWIGEVVALSLYGVRHRAIRSLFGSGGWLAHWLKGTRQARVFGFGRYAGRTDT